MISKSQIRKTLTVFVIASIIISGSIPALNPVGTAKAESLDWKSSTGTNSDGFGSAVDRNNNEVYFGDDSGNIYHFDRNGNLLNKWQPNTHQINDLKYDPNSGLVYVHNWDGTNAIINAFNPNTGTIEWTSRSVGSNAGRKLAINKNNGNVILTGHGEAAAFDNTGTELWSVASEVKFQYTPNGSLFGADGSTVAEYNPTNGNVIQSTSISYSAWDITYLNGKVFAHDRSTVYRYDSSSLSLDWSKAIGNDIRYLATDNDAHIYAADYGDTALLGLDINGNKDFNHTSSFGSSIRKVNVNPTTSNVKAYVSDIDYGYQIDTGFATTSTVSGNVVDKSTGNVIENAGVKIEDSNGKLVFDGSTDVNGDFSTELNDGNYSINISKSGYYKHEDTFSVSGSSVNLGTIELQSIPKLSGTVINQSSGNGINNSTVKILDNGTVIDQTTTNPKGEFGFELDNGTYTINVTHLNYYPYEDTINVSGDTKLSDIGLDPKEYNLVMRVSPYMNHSQSQKYVVRFNDDTITENVTVTSSNKTLITVNQTTLTLNSTSIVNDTGEVNITATYKVDGLTLRDSKNVTVAPIEIQHVEILSPLYSSLAIATDKSIQFLVLAIIAGVGIATVTNAFGGIALMIISLIMGWIMDYIPLGVLLASLFGGIFIMLNTRLREYRVK